MSELLKEAKNNTREELINCVHRIEQHIRSHYGKIDELEERRQLYIRQLVIPRKVASC